MALKYFNFNGKSIPVALQLIEDNTEISLSFGYHEGLKNFVKGMQGAHWVPEKKCWAIRNNERNWFQLNFLLGNDPFRKYKTPWKPYVSHRDKRSHQCEITGFILARRQCYIAGDPGIGKSLSALEALEVDKGNSYLWVCPKNVIWAIETEIKKWGIKKYIELMTYEKATSLYNKDYLKPEHYDGVIWDEAQKLKNPRAQRTIAAIDFSAQLRAKDKIVVAMSGTPNPKSPVDWWAQLEVVCPGYVKESSPNKLTERLAVFELKSSEINDVKYTHIIAWKDGADICNVCGDPREIHGAMNSSSTIPVHQYTPCVNELKLFYDRIDGLILKKLKKDCLDLPEIQYVTRICKPDPVTIAAAKIIMETETSAVRALIKCRELSDGFQYQPDGSAVHIPCAKDPIVKDYLEEYEDVGRFVMYAGFSASVEKLCTIAFECGWDFIKIDGQGVKFKSHSVGLTPYTNLIEWFQDKKANQNKTAFIGNPGSAGAGITLTASPAILFYSNDFNGDSREQAIHRIHRIGMDENRGATVIDLINLSVDLKVRNNLMKKKDLSMLTLGEIRQTLQMSAEDLIECQ